MGEILTLWTIRIALGFYVLAEVAWLGAALQDVLRSEPRGGRGRWDAHSISPTSVVPFTFTTTGVTLSGLAEPLRGRIGRVLLTDNKPLVVYFSVDEGVATQN